MLQQEVHKRDHENRLQEKEREKKDRLRGKRKTSEMIYI